MLPYDETTTVLGTVWPGCWYLVDGVPAQPSVIMDATEWQRRQGCLRQDHRYLFPGENLSSTEKRGIRNE